MARSISFSLLDDVEMSGRLDAVVGLVCFKEAVYGGDVLLVQAIYLFFASVLLNLHLQRTAH